MPEARLQRTRELYEVQPGEMYRIGDAITVRFPNISRYDAQWCRLCGSHRSAHAPECAHKDRDAR